MSRNFEKNYLIVFTLEIHQYIWRNQKSWDLSNLQCVFASDLLSLPLDQRINFLENESIYRRWGILNLSFDEQDMTSLGIDSSFYANLSSRIINDVFSVSFEGSFVSPGVYGAKQGEKLSDLIKRAGGYKKMHIPTVEF